MVENPLLENSKEFFESGEDNLKKKRYNAATDSFFKATVTLCDYYINKKIHLLPKNHTERFELLEINFPEVYKIIRKLFTSYRKTYNLKSDAEDALRTKRGYNEVKRIFESKKNL